MDNTQALKELNRLLTKSEVKSRPDSGQRYVDGEFITSQLNKIFGNTNFSTRIESMEKVQDTTGTSKAGKEVFKVGYLCRMVLTVPNLTTGVGTIEINEIGAGSGIDADLLKAHESAAKEAATDTLKRCAMRLGNSLGLCLYDKDFKAAEESKYEKAMNELFDNSSDVVDEVDVPTYTGSSPRNVDRDIYAHEIFKNAAYQAKDSLKKQGFKFDAGTKRWVKKTSLPLDTIPEVEGIIYKEVN